MYNQDWTQPEKAKIRLEKKTWSNDQLNQWTIVIGWKL
jgi:hypothetical protein